MISVDVSVKKQQNIVCAKNIVLEILPYVLWYVSTHTCSFTQYTL